MDLQIFSNTSKIDVHTHSLYPTITPSPRMIWYKDEIVRFELQINSSGFSFVDILMVGTASWQLDNEGHGLGLPVSEINGVNVSAKTNNEIMDYLYTL